MISTGTAHSISGSMEIPMPTLWQITTKIQNFIETTADELVEDDRMGKQ